MPFFIVQNLNNPVSVMVKAESKDELSKEAVRKLDLPEGDHDIILANEGTAVDDDVIAFANINQTNLLKIIIQDRINKPIALTNTGETASPSNERSATLDLDDIFMNVCPDVKQSCNNGAKLSSNQWLTFKRMITEYMMVTLEDCSRNTAYKIARLVCTKYPKTFSITVEGKEWSDGIDTFARSVINGIQYKKSICNPKRKQVSDPEDSDDEAIQKCQKRIERSLKNDAYGCAEYSTELPDDETDESQEEKRLRLIILFENPEMHSSSLVTSLMNETYPTQRINLNASCRNLTSILTNWPFLKDPHILIQHASRLLGKNVSTIWSDSMEKKVKFLRQYLKMYKSKDDNLNQMIKMIFTECDKAILLNGSKMPKIDIAIPLLITYFKEESVLLYILLESEASEADMAKSVTSDYPLLVIKGSSIHDENGAFIVVIEKENQIICENFLHSILVLFLSYYVFGYTYRPGAEKTLEFIQRIFLDINPKTGTKKNTKTKRSAQSYNAEVLKFANLLNKFSNNFNVDED